MMRYRFMNFMRGRNGMDSLGRFLMIAVMVITLFSSFFFYPLMMVSYLLFAWAIFRFFSRNTYKRAAENRKYLEITDVVRKSFKLTKNKFRDRKTHRYFNCPTCHNTLRVPRGRGEIRVSCPVCKTITVTKS